MVMFPLCFTFFTFFLSLGGSFRALMIRAAAEGTTETVAVCSEPSAERSLLGLSNLRCSWRCRHQSSWERDPGDPPWGPGRRWLQPLLRQLSGRCTSPRWDRTWAAYWLGCEIMYQEMQLFRYKPACLVVDEGSYNLSHYHGVTLYTSFSEQCWV